MQDFVRVLAHFRPIKKNAEKNKLNTRMEKLHFAFRMYDLDGDDKISKVSALIQDKLQDFHEQNGKASKRQL
jgi:Ca2+-binding EF-hand superfamily protein